MRVVVFFDLPVLTAGDKKEYRAFRRYLIKSGFMMMQESVYCKLAVNGNATETIIENVKKHKPKAGLVQALRVTEKQYQKMEYVVGERNSTVLNTDDRVVIL